MPNYLLLLKLMDDLTAATRPLREGEFSTGDSVVQLSK